MKNRILLYAVVVFQVAVIGAIALSKGYTRLTGRKIMVKVVPVDPRSLFRGDYVILKYDFSTVDLAKHGFKDEVPPRGEYLFLTLKRGPEGFWALESVSPEFPEAGAGDDDIVVRGLIANEARSSKRADFIFGIESYFVPEGEGKYIERYREKKDLSAEIAVDRYGRAAVVKLFIAGEEVRFD